MILLVDAGNTRTKWRLLDNQSGFSESGFFNNNFITLTELERKFKSFVEIQIVISCVAADTIFQAFKDFAELRAFEIYHIRPKQKMNGIIFGYEEINRLGVDRCLAMIGAFENEGLLVVDAGSAITADYIADNGHHLGGYILPGYNMSRSALLGNTANIGLMAQVGVYELGKSTDACVNNGFAVMFRSLLSALIQEAKTHEIKRYVLTGGDAEMLKDFCIDEVEVVENLVLDGLLKYFAEGVDG